MNFIRDTSFYNSDISYCKRDISIFNPIVVVKVYYKLRFISPFISDCVISAFFKTRNALCNELQIALQFNAVCNILQIVRLLQIAT